MESDETLTILTVVLADLLLLAVRSTSGSITLVGAGGVLNGTNLTASNTASAGTVN